MIRLLSRVLIMALCIPMAGLAQTAAPGSSTGKIVWLNVDSAVVSCDEGKAEFGKIQQYVDEKSAEMKGMRTEFESLKNQLNVQGEKLTDEARSDLEYDISTKDTALQRFQQDTQKDINNRRDKAYAYILKRLQPVMEKMAHEKGYAAIFVINPNRDLYIDPTLDITDELVKAYNQTYPVSAAKPAAPSTLTP